MYDFFLSDIECETDLIDTIVDSGVRLSWVRIPLAFYCELVFNNVENNMNLQFPSHFVDVTSFVWLIVYKQSFLICRLSSEKGRYIFKQINWTQQCSLVSVATTNRTTRSASASASDDTAATTAATAANATHCWWHRPNTQPPPPCRRCRHYLFDLCKNDFNHQHNVQ